MKKFSRFISVHSKLILIVGILLLIPSLIGYANTGINYDILSYLPENLGSVKGEKVLDEVFSDASTGILIVEGMEEKDIDKMKEKIKKIEGVNDALWLYDALDLSVPMDILPSELSNQIYKDDATMVVIKFNESMASESTMKAIDKIRGEMNDQCFLSGMSAILKDTKDLADKEAPFYILIAVILSVLVLFLSMESTIVPIIFLVSIGFGILYNLGSNIVFGEISYITKALAAVLQLGVTMDYSIFLMHRYDEELEKNDNRIEAMTEAISATMISISASSLTTVAGFLALCTMDLTLGTDIGMVMAKGVVIGVICSVTILPAFILAFDKIIHRFKHKTILPEFNHITNLVSKHYKLVIVVFLVTLLPAFFAQNNASVYYNLDETLPKDMDSIVATNKMKDKFNMMTSHFIVVKDDIPSYKIKEMSDKIEKIDGVTAVVSFEKFVGPNLPEEFIPDNIREIFEQGGYRMILVNSSYKSAQDEENAQILEIENLVKEYDEEGMVTGEGVLTKDLINIADSDFKKVSFASILAIFLIILVVFKSVSIPVLLVASIEYAIFINMGIPYCTGTVIPFIASIVIGTIQLGATVDYAILMTSRFKEEINNGHKTKEAVQIALKGSAKSIMTSGLTFFGATGGVALVSDMELIKSLCLLISRGSVISMVVILFVLPSLLMVSEGLINKTTIGWKKNIKIDNSVNNAM
ncbi:MMPL family transporter [uncultured Clostridium sp.]|uniref:efflux RND transporter permease subunit n=1 Tax=uncultured Clostridium sp. TaxID=59620 RepID=UPI0025CCE49E|nr:MMPL family transporter [uncultured Clostridium sp.]